MIIEKLSTEPSLPTWKTFWRNFLIILKLIFNSWENRSSRRIKIHTKSPSSYHIFYSLNFHYFSPFECLLTQPQPSTGSNTNKALRFDSKNVTNIHIIQTWLEHLMWHYECNHFFSYCCDCRFLDIYLFACSTLEAFCCCLLVLCVLKTFTMKIFLFILQLRRVKKRNENITKNSVCLLSNELISRQCSCSFTPPPLMIA